MGVFGFFKEKNKRQTINNNIENEIKRLYADKKYDEVVSRAESFFVDGQETPLGIKQMIGLSFFYKKDYEKALTILEEIALEKNDVESWFNVLMSLMLANKPQEGKKVFNRILKLHNELKSNQPRELGINFIKYYYACGLNDAGLFDDALEQLEDIKKTYIEMKITDDTFVYIRGVPFLSDTLNLAKKIFNGLNIDFNNSGFINELETAIDDEGKKLIKKYREQGN